MISLPDQLCPICDAPQRLFGADCYVCSVNLRDHMHEVDSDREYFRWCSDQAWYAVHYEEDRTVLQTMFYAEYGRLIEMELPPIRLAFDHKDTKMVVEKFGILQAYQ